MRAQVWSRRLLAAVAVMAVSATGCKTLNERYIALEVWKYERCFGHLPPGFTPPGAVQPAAAASPRVCGQQQQGCDSAPVAGGCDSAPVAGGCDSCEGGGGAVVHEGMQGMPSLPAGAVVPAGPGGSPGPATTLPTPAGITAGKPVVISDEVVIP
jgi:hypothetical protein